MSIYDPATGFRRQLTYEETLNLIKRQDADADKAGGPGINREATRFVQSPFFERLKDSVYGNLQQQQVLQALAEQNEANVRRVAADTGVPPQLAGQMGPPGPPGPPPGPPGPPPGGAGTGGAASLSRSPEPPGSEGGTGGPSRGEAGQPRRPDYRGSRSPPPKRGQIDGMEDDDDPPPPPAAGAVSIPVGAASIPTGITPETHAMVNQTRLEAELRKLAEERDIASRRAAVAENVANSLHAQNMNNPILIAQQYFGGQPRAAPAAAPAAPPTVSPAAVMQAVKAAMQGERRTLQDMMAHHGASMREVVQSAVTQSAASSSTTPHQTLIVTPAEDAGVKVPGKVKDIARIFETGGTQKKAKPSAAGGVTAPTPTPAPKPSSVPTAPTPAPKPSSAPTEPITQGIKRKERYDNPDVEDLEDIYFAERRRDNPAASLQKARKKKERADILSRRPIILGPDPLPDSKKRKADGELAGPNRKRPNPAPQKEGVRNAARSIMDALYRISAPSRTQSKRDLNDIMRRSVGQTIRMDQFDNKRSYDDISREVDEVFDDMARKRIGMPVSDIQLPRRRAA